MKKNSVVIIKDNKRFRKVIINGDNVTMGWPILAEVVGHTTESYLVRDMSFDTPFVEAFPKILFEMGYTFEEIAFNELSKR